MGQQNQSQSLTTVSLYTLPPDDPTLTTCISASKIVMQLKVNLRADANHKILMTVNGKPSLDYENHVLMDGEQIVIVYT